MPTPNTLEICRTDLFTRETESQERYPQVIFYYDATALGSNYAVNEQEFFLRFTTKATSSITILST